MEYILSGNIGAAHLAFAILSMILGPLSILQEKGSRPHKLLGYLYIIGMLGLNVTALLIYDLFGSFGPFHYAALFSLATVAAGFIPVYLKKPRKGWIELHYEFMNWSVVGLYAAFWAEVFTHFFRFADFWIGIAIAVALTISIGGLFIKKNKKRLIQSIKMTDF